jgi:hypothetical protein
MRQLALTLILNLMGAAALLGGSVSSARASDADGLREARDRNEIQGLMWRYVRALDSFDADAYAAVFTPDGQFGSGTNAAKGRDALKKMVLDLKKQRAEREAKGEPKSPPMYHVITNSYVEFVDKDHARYYAYWLTVFGQGGRQAAPQGSNNSGQESAPRIAAAGRSIDDVVRLNGQWLIKSRNVAPQD